MFDIPKTTDLDGYSFIDLFAGIGGFHVALAAHGAKCVFASEKNKNAAKTYEKNHGLKPAGDITVIAAEEIPAHDILCGGFPCQPFSAAGKRLGLEDSRGELFWEIVRIAKHHQPRVLFLENVVGLLRHDKGRTYEVIKNAIEDVGYGVHYKIVNATEAWLPQNRERVFIVCLRRDINVGELPYFFPALTSYQVDLILEDAYENEVSVINRPVNFSTPYDKTHGWKGGRNRVQRLGGFGKQGQGARVYDARGLGVTLCAGGGGGGALTGIYDVSEGRGEKLRTLTAREAARMAGFPDSFKPHGNERAALKQFGNCVCPPAADYVLQSIRQVLRWEREGKFAEASLRIKNPAHGRELDPAVLPGLGGLDEIPGDVALRDPDASGDGLA